FAGDSLSANIKVAETAAASEASPFGYVNCDIEVDNQAGDQVIALTTSLMIGHAGGASSDG
ncbi:MAG: hypothetical protein AAF699_15960, partial [Pseudomonadota bacterium]